MLLIFLNFYHRTMVNMGNMQEIFFISLKILTRNRRGSDQFFEVLAGGTNWLLDGVRQGNYH